MKPKILFIKVKKALTKSGLPDLDYALNPYMGCWHSCTYCYARLYTWIREVSEKWGDVIAVKTNLIEVLSREIKYLSRGVVGVGTITDPYQPIEAVYKLTRQAVTLLVENGFHVSIQTKNPLILRDLDVLKKHKDKVDVGFTITTLDNKKAKTIEPRAPPPTARAEALRKIASQGIETWIFYGPVIPTINDNQETVNQLIRLAKETNSKLLIDNLHIKKFMYYPTHPLYNIVPIARRYNWRGFIEKILAKCREEDVQCIPGLAEPKQGNITLDKYFSRDKMPPN